MVWTASDWENARNRWPAVLATRDNAADAFGELTEEQRQHINTAVGLAAANELVRLSQNLGPTQRSLELPGYPDDEARARRANENASAFLVQFGVVDRAITRNAERSVREALEAAGWRQARDYARAAGATPETQAPIDVTPRAGRTARPSRWSMWPMLLGLGLLLFRKGR